MMNNTSIINIQREAHLTSFGNTKHGNRKGIIAVDTGEPFNAIQDFRRQYHVSYSSVYNALHDKNYYVRLFKIDENGNKVCIGKTRLTYTAHAVTAMDMIMIDKRQKEKDHHKIKEENEHLRNENKLLKKQIAEQNATIKKEAKKRKENEKVIKAIMDARKAEQNAIKRREYAEMMLDKMEGANLYA